MQCDYYFEGRLIGDEMQLADFLLSKYKYLSKFGDLVFDLTDRALSVNSKLVGEIYDRGQKSDAKLKNYVSKHGIDYDEDGRVINLDPPAMGVNRMLQKFTHLDGPMKGHRIIPEFIKEEYWRNKRAEWEKGRYDDKDKELISEFDPAFLFDITATKDKMDEWQDKIQTKWDAQGKTGTALHAVSELFFSKTNGTYNFELLAQNPNLRQEWYDNNFKNAQDTYGKITYGDWVSLDQFNSMLDMCEKLRKQLESEYGTGLTFYPEFTIACDLSAPFFYEEANGRKKECKEIIGIIDLLVIDSKGRTHIFDYKTSPKAYADYASAKQRGFTYQLAVYDRILSHYGIYTGDGSVNIIPIKLDGFKYDYPNSKWTFDDISYEVSKNSTNIVNIKKLPIKGDTKIAADIDEFLPSGVDLEVYSDNLIENTQKQLQEWCPTYLQKRNMNDELIREMIEKRGGFKKKRNGEYEFKFEYGFGKPIIVAADSPNPEAEMFKKVKEEIESWPNKKQRMAEAFVDAFKTAVKDQTAFEFSKAELGKGKQNSLYLSQLITPYCDGSYKIIENSAALCMGIVMLENIHDSTITVLKLTGSMLDYLHEFIPGRTNMNGAFAADIEEDAKGNSLMLKSINANIEAIEAMLALQNMEYNNRFIVNEIKVINPYQLTGLPVSNKELLYTFNNLVNKKNVLGTAENKFAGSEPKIKLASDVYKLKQQFMNILDRLETLGGTFGENTDKFNEFIKPEMQRLNILDWNAIPKAKLYDELHNLAIRLEETYKSQLKGVSRNLSDLLRPETDLYNQIMMTMLELKNIDVRQQIKDADNWVEHLNIFKHGWEGLMLENNGNFKSQILNRMVKSVTNVYLKVKDKVNKENVTIRKLVANLKKQKNFGWVRSNISGNQTDMYKDMTYVSSDGDFLFVNPNTLQGAEREFLEHALEVINKNRWPSESEDNIRVWKETEDVRYYRVPLMAASDASKMSTNNMLASCKDRLKNLNPKNAIKELQEKAMGVFDALEKERTEDKLKIYEMNNIFDSGENEETRMKILHGENGANAFEHNIETILLLHCYSYELKNQMTREMPLIKASAIALSMQGAGANLETGNVNNLLDFVENYVKGVIKNQSIVDPKFHEAQAALGKARKVASFLALAFSPLQFTKQTLEGIWKACSLIIKKPDGTNAFTLNNMWDAFTSAYKDLAHYSDNPSKCQLINEIYGLNDMDANLFAKRISSDHGIWTHFTDFAFRFASRPDYYNRLTIFGAQMRNDGTWDAHEVVDGELVYNFKKDKRYAAMFTAPKGSAEYNEALSKYIAALEQFKAEGVTKEDGSELEFGDDLPRAYTNQEAQGMKAIADNMYGYYNHENKSMMSSMLLGALSTQMKTYWSAKKNQYFAPGGVKLMGKWEDYKEPKMDADGNVMKNPDGSPILELLYYATNESGEIDLSKGMVREGDSNCSGVKVLKWQGLWQEGVFVTATNFLLSCKNVGWNETLKNTWYNSDANLRRSFRSNVKHIALDLFFLALVGNAIAALTIPWEEEKEKEFRHDQGDMQKACEYAAASLLTDSFKYSFMDFNFFDSIFSPVTDWQPFAFSSLGRLAKNSFEYIVTDKPFTSTVVNSVPALRQTKPIIKCIGYNEE